MARIAGVDLPRNKKIEFALQYIYGIGPHKAKEILDTSSVDPDTRVNKLSEEQVMSIRNELSENHLVEGELRSTIGRNIKRLIDAGTYRGSRHKKKLPVRGQRTHCNARTRKGKAIAIAGKKLTPLKK